MPTTKPRAKPDPLKKAIKNTLSIVLEHGDIIQEIQDEIAQAAAAYDVLRKDVEADSAPEGVGGLYTSMVRLMRRPPEGTYLREVSFQSPPPGGDTRVFLTLRFGKR